MNPQEKLKPFHSCSNVQSDLCKNKHISSGAPPPLQLLLLLLNTNAPRVGTITSKRNVWLFTCGANLLMSARSLSSAAWKLHYFHTPQCTLVVVFISNEFSCYSFIHSFIQKKSKTHLRNSLFSIPSSNKSVFWQGQSQRRRTPDGR